MNYASIKMCYSYSWMAGTMQQVVYANFELEHDILVGWLCLTSHRQRRHLETTPPFTVPWEGREARWIHRSDRSITWQSITLPLRYASSTEHDISWMTGFNFYSMICWLKIWANELIKAVYFLRFEHLGTIARNIKDFYLIFMKYLWLCPATLV